MRTGIVGLGALGSSLGLALRSQKGWADVTGFDSSARAQNDAKRKGAIREGTSDIADLLSDADIVVLAIPPLAVIEFLRDFGPGLRADTVVTDLATSKQAIVEAAERTVPARSGFVGGHPLVSCASGTEQADAGLFRGRPWCLAAAIGTPADRLDAVSALVEAAGARAYFIDPAEHDAWVAGVEGLPRIMAAALARVSGSSDAWRELVRVSGIPFESVVAASGSPQETRELALTTGPALVSWLDRLQAELDLWRDAVAASRGDVLERQFADAAAMQARWNVERTGQALKPDGKA
ncbi:MAG: prephenate dehydrogenase [Chloroflexota bacterium]